MANWLSHKYQKWLSVRRGFSATNQRVVWIVLILTFVLIPLLAILQYIWLNQLSVAEKVRMEANLKLSVERYAEDFDTELTRIYTAFRAANIVADKSLSQTLADAFIHYNQQNPVPGLIADVYAVRIDSVNLSRMQYYDPQEKKLVPTSWPSDLQKLQSSISVNDMTYFQTLISMSHAPMLEDPPYIIIHNIPRRITDFAENFSQSFLIIVLNKQAITERLLPMLDQRYFYADSIPLYQTAIIKADSTNSIFYRSGEEKAAVFVEQADQFTQIGNWRTGEIMIATANINLQDTIYNVSDKTIRLKSDKRFSIEMVRRDSVNRNESFNFIVARTIPWRLYVRHIQGSLESVVQQAHTRNLMISYLILLLLGLSVVFVLYTSRKAQKSARQQIEFVAGLTHELRTPLATIRSAAENIKDGVVTSSGSLKDYGRLIYDEDLRLTNMIEQALQFSGMSNGEMKNSKKSVNLSQVVKSVCDEFAEEDRGLIDLKIDAGIYIRANVYAFKIVLRNLISNALKYNYENKPVKISSELQATDSLLYLHIRDQGIGIEEQELQEIFKPFYRGQFAKDQQIQGSGIGLSLVQKIVSEHDGKIRVKSQPGRGSTFTLILPYSRSASDV